MPEAVTAAVAVVVAAPRVFIATLWPKWPHDVAVREILVVGSASDELSERVIERTLRRYDDANLHALLGVEHAARARGRWPRVTVEAIDSAENKLAPGQFLRRQQGRRFDVTAIIFSGEAGYGRRKLIGLLAGSRIVMGYNPDTESFVCNVREGRRVLSHFAPRRPRLPSIGLARVLLAPLGYVVVLARVVPLLLGSAIRKGSPR